MTEQDSYEEYKRFLEDELGVPGIKPPPRLMTPYLRFAFERTCEEKSKGNTNLKDLSKTLGEEWKVLPSKKKEYYEKIYQVRLRERGELLSQYEFLNKKKKPINGYVKYYKMRFKQLTKTNTTLKISEIAKMAVADWKNLSQSEKNKYNVEAAEEEITKNLTGEEKEERVQVYKESIKRFAEELRDEKQKISKKYGIQPNRKQQRIAQRMRRNKARLVQREVEKVKKEEERNRKRQEDKEAKLQQKEAEKKRRQAERKEKREAEKQKKVAEAAVKKEDEIRLKAKAPKSLAPKGVKGGKAPRAPKPAKKVTKKKQAAEKKTPVKKTKKIKKTPKSKPKKSKKKAEKKVAPKKVKTEVKKQVKQEIKEEAPKPVKPAKKVTTPKRASKRSKK